MPPKAQKKKKEATKAIPTPTPSPAPETAPSSGSSSPEPDSPHPSNNSSGENNPAIGQRRTWQPDEDTILLQSLKELKVKEGLMSDNGFKQAAWQRVSDNIAEAGFGPWKAKQCTDRYYKVSSNLH